MKTYWDHTYEERAALSSAEVDELLKYELMSEGIVIPPDPGPKPESPDCDLDYLTVYDVTKPGKYSGRDTVVTFSNADDASRFCGMEVIESDYRHDIGYEHKFAVYVHDMRVSERQVLSRESLERHASTLEKHKQSVDAHAEESKAFSDMKTKAVKACESIWEDWHIRHAEAARVQEVLETYQRYISDCDGNEEIAMRFLRKAYDGDLVDKAIGPSVVEKVEEPVTV